MNRLLIYFADSKAPAERLASETGLPSAEINVHHFPDGESLVTLPEPLPGKIVIYMSLNRPNQKLTELLLAARGAMNKGVKELILVVPYLAYMRQDKAFKKGEVVSQKVIGRFLSELFGTVVTVDAHLHRVRSLGQVLPRCKSLNLKTAELTADYIVKNYPGSPFLLGPDEESHQWVKTIATIGGFDYGVCKKVRYGDDKVRVELPQLRFKHKPVILVDDIVSTGHTLSATALRLAETGTTYVDCIVTHALFVRGALSLLRKSGIKRIVTTDTVHHSTNRIFVAPVIARGLSRLI